MSSFSRIKTLTLAAVLTSGVFFLASSPAVADPWKDESGHGRYLSEGYYEEKPGKIEYYENGCKIEEKYKDGEYEKEVKCDDRDYAYSGHGNHRYGRGHGDWYSSEHSHDYGRAVPRDDSPEDESLWQHPNSGSKDLSEYDDERYLAQRPSQGDRAGPCREYNTTVQIDGRWQHLYGLACRQPDGSWRFVQ